MATVKSCSAFAVVAGLTMLSLFSACVSGQVSQDSAASAISEAEDAVVLGYEAVLGAEAAGGNVTSLLARLSDAAALVTDARRAFDVNDFDEAKVLADQAAAAAGVVWDDAKSLEAYAAEINANRKTSYIVASCVGVPLVAVAGFLGYRFFKRRYYERLLKMKPEVEKA